MSLARPELNDGQELVVRVDIRGVDVETRETRPVEGLQPILVRVFNPRGESSFYSRQAMCRDGHYEFRLALASNDIKGEWKVEVEELSSHLTGSEIFTLQ